MSKERMLDLNRQNEDNINRIKNMGRTANQTLDTSNNINNELGGQR